jgi:hypothetical protein
MQVSALQSQAQPGTMFQVASNFNCLEFGSVNCVVESGQYCTHLMSDHTQGPAAASGCGLAAITQAHAAFYDPKLPSEAWGQSRDRSAMQIFCFCALTCANRQVELLGDPALRSHFPVVNGKLLPYLMEEMGPSWNAQAVSSLMPLVKCGLHCNAQAVFERNSDGTAAFNPHGPMLDQVFVATMNCRTKGSQQLPQAERESKVQFLLDAAYSAT